MLRRRLIAGLVTSVIVACSGSTEPSDITPISVDLPNLSVPLLAASGDRLISLQAIDSLTRALDNRSLTGDLRWTTTVPACPTGLECVLALDASSNIYLNTSSGLMSRSGSSGSLRWTNTAIEAPAIAVGTNDRLYAPGRPLVGTQLMHAIAANSGNVIWTTILPPNLDATGALLDETRGIVYAIGRGAAAALDAQTGAIKWITSQNCGAGSDGALASDGTVYVTCDISGASRLFAYTPNGSLAWQANLGTATITNAPVIDASGMIYVANTNALTALNKDGSTAWRFAGLFRNVTNPIVDADRNVFIVASRISSVSGRYLMSIKDGTFIETTGLYPCVGSLLLNEGGRLYCAEVGVFVYMRTAGNDANAQWAQMSHDAARSARR
jgi:outer membrane protein assembly factor BamB